LNAIAGIDLPDDAIKRRPGGRLSSLMPPERLREFLEVLKWAEIGIQGASHQA
jgi:hypothetical protein